MVNALNFFDGPGRATSYAKSDVFIIEMCCQNPKFLGSSEILWLGRLLMWKIVAGLHSMFLFRYHIKQWIKTIFTHFFTIQIASKHAWVAGSRNK